MGVCHNLSIDWHRYTSISADHSDKSSPTPISVYHSDKSLPTPFDWMFAKGLRGGNKNWVDLVYFIEVWVLSFKLRWDQRSLFYLSLSVFLQIFMRSKGISVIDMTVIVVYTVVVYCPGVFIIVYGW